jgi:peptidoglycan/xylan/chitin deacetylase (PgdA/CDA1 family)
MHNVFKDEQDSFRRLLQVLSYGHHFISYSEAVERIWSGNIDGSYITFSFDDGLKTCLDAARIMNEFGAKACFFLCPSMIGETDYDKIKAFCSQRLYTLPIEFLSWNDVELLLEDGHEVGGHTVNHPNLARLSPVQAQTETAESFTLLSKQVGRIEHFAWPYGRFSHFGPTQAKLVFEAGFQSCASGERGCHVAPQEQKSQLCLRRDHILAGWPLDHIYYFMARNSQVASAQTNEWPEGWFETVSPRD